MKKLLLILLLAVVSSNAMAERVEFAGTDEGTIFYGDPATIRKSGNNVKMWILKDFGTLQLDSFISAKEKGEYDCKEKQWRVLFSALYSENMGRGETVSILNVSMDWEPVPPDSVVEAMLEFACRFRPTPLTFPDETFS